MLSRRYFFLSSLACIYGGRKTMKEILLAVILAIAMLVAYRRAARFGYENGFIDGYTSITEQIPLD
jgi:hypothetical protein